MQKKEEIEREIKHLGDVLASQKNVGMHSPLVDAEGYPRMDIDVAQVRHARHRIICLQNDHKAVMKEIEENLHHVLAKNAETGDGPRENMDVDEITENLTPIARVDKVMSGSPAEFSGLMEGDKLVKFGSVTSENFRNLQDISTVVQHSVGKPLELTVLRNSKPIQLHLTPSTWSGRGLLGCNLMPA